MSFVERLSMYLIDKVPMFCPICGRDFSFGMNALWNPEQIQYFYVGEEHKCKCGEVFRYQNFGELGRPAGQAESPSIADG
jgi:hypothetical protein